MSLNEVHSVSEEFNVQEVILVSVVRRSLCEAYLQVDDQSFEWSIGSVHDQLKLKLLDQ